MYELMKSVLRATVPRPVRSWLRSPSKSARWIWDAIRHSVGSNEFLQPCPNWTVICHPRAYRVAHEAQVCDPEQREEFENFLRYCGAGMFLLDVGAHFGIFSLAAAHFGGRAIAVDPSPIATRMIAKQLALNNLKNSVQIIQAAVGDKDGTLDMVSAGVYSDGYFKFDGRRGKSELTRVKATTIDQLAGQFGVPTHIKIDVEGHEAAVLRGGRNVLRRFAPILLVELHNEIVAADGRDPNDALDELTEMGYNNFSSTGKRLNREGVLKKPLIRIEARKSAVSVAR